MTLDKTLKYAGLAIAGGAVGAAIGMLIAPASGAETRKLISDRIESEREEFLRRLRRDPRREEGYPYSVISAWEEAPGGGRVTLLRRRSASLLSHRRRIPA